VSGFVEHANVKIRHKMERLSELDGLRAVSILLVLAAHLLPLGPKFLQLNAAAGAMGMSLFFALSGFLIASRLLISPTVPEFIVRRMARILPLVYLFLVMLLVAFNEPISKVLWSSTFLVNYKTEYLSGLNSHLWSLCVEVQFYVAIAITVLALGGRAVWLVWPACFVVTWLRIDAGGVLDIRTHLRVDEILAGACVACLFYWFGKARFSLPIALLPCAIFNMLGPTPLRLFFLQQFGRGPES
jgi:peptidoglycan/LPS O-acetylase OafA/YrhL